MGNIVLWSGGADSTLVLHQYAGASAEDYPVRAISVKSHPYLGSPFMAAQNKARGLYLDFAKGRGYHIKHEEVDVSGDFEFLTAEHGEYLAQPIMWLSVLFQVVGNEDNVLLSYIKSDIFWHRRHEFEEAFKALLKLKNIKATIEYPVEFYEKADVLRELKREKVPNNAWFVCESTTNGELCGQCCKCDEIKYAKKHWRYKSEKRPE